MPACPAEYRPDPTEGTTRTSMTFPSPRSPRQSLPQCITAGGPVRDAAIAPTATASLAVLFTTWAIPSPADPAGEHRPDLLPALLLPLPASTSNADMTDLADPGSDHYTRRVIDAAVPPRH